MSVVHLSSFCTYLYQFYKILFLFYYILNFMQPPNPHIVQFFIDDFFHYYELLTCRLHSIKHNNKFGGSIMSDLTASNCGCSNDNNCCSSIIWIIILLALCGNKGNNCGCGCGSGFLGGNDNGCGCEILIILLLLSCCGGNFCC